MFVIDAVRTTMSEDQSHEHVALVGYASGHIEGESIFIPVERVPQRQMLGEKFGVIVAGQPVEVSAGRCPVCGYEPALKTAADSGDIQQLLELARA